MLILSQDGHILYDTRSGVALHAIDKDTYDNSMAEIIADTIDNGWFVMGKYHDLDAAMAALRELYIAAQNGDMVEEIQ